ncbi:MAG: PEP-CTERM sorting domain-containing protein [Verrucomicrobiota bacterium]
MGIRCLLTAYAVSFCLHFTTSASASLIAEWNFDDSDLIADSGSQVSTSGLTTTGGTVSFPTRGGGNALHLGGSTDPQSFTIELSGTGLSDFQINYEGVSDVFVFFFTFQTSFEQSWSWSTDNVNFSTAGITTQPGPITSTGGYDSFLVDLAGVSAIENAPSVFLRNDIQPVLGGTTSLRFDNLSVTAVPEPSGLIAMLLGLVILCTAGKRFLKPHH